MSRDGTRNCDRFPARKDDQGRCLCRFCGKPVTPPKQSFCGPRCLRDFFMVTDWQRVRRVIYERDGGRCMKCGREVSRKEYHVDHIVALTNGGDEWDLGNLELSCPRCNLSKGARAEQVETLL